jgi:hypothetical protein
MDGVASQKKTLVGWLESPPPPKWRRINSPASHSRVGNVTGWATCAGRGCATRDQPSPAARVTQTRCGFFSVKVLKSSAAESGLFVNSQ